MKLEILRWVCAPVTAGMVWFFVHSFFLFCCTLPYLPILVLSQVPGFRETLSYLRRQHIVLSEEVK